MKLKEVDAKIVQYKGLGICRVWNGPINQGHGLEFECPNCLARSTPATPADDRKPRHKIVCWSIGVPRGLPPVGRWGFYGTSLEDLTIDAPEPTIRIGKPCDSEYMIRDGDLMILS